ASAEDGPGCTPIEAYVAGEQVSHERPLDPSVARQGDRDGALVGGHTIRARDPNATHGDRHVLCVDPRDAALPDVHVRRRDRVDAALAQVEHVDFNVVEATADDGPGRD